MTIYSSDVKALFEEFNEIAARSQRLAIFTCAIELQEHAVQRLTDFIEKATAGKTNGKESFFCEEDLNLILFVIVTCEAVRAELLMIVSLKIDEMDIAWGHLVFAQTHIGIAARNHPVDHRHFNGYVARLYGYEKLLFPKLMFASVGGIIKSTKCSICQREYEKCDHMKGKMYKGELCVREIHEMDLEEISLVEDPANKLCRQLSAHFEGKDVNPFTLREQSKSDEVHQPAELQA